MQSCFSISALICARPRAKESGEKDLWRVSPGTCLRVHLVPAGSGGHDLGVAENWLESI